MRKVGEEGGRRRRKELGKDFNKKVGKAKIG
jgi:hypothetical protein